MAHTSRSTIFKSLAVLLAIEIIFMLASPLLAKAAGTDLSAGDIVVLAINGDIDATNSY